VVSIPWATCSLPLPLVAGVGCKIDRRQSRARRQVTSASVPASLLPIPQLLL
jgi:hypothetical protein